MGNLGLNCWSDQPEDMQVADSAFARPDFEFTEFQIRKFRRAFKMKDQGFFGKVREADFVHWGKKSCQIANSGWTNEKEIAWKSVYHMHFGEKNEVSCDEWINHLLTFFKMLPSDEAFLEVAWKGNKKLYDTIDLNQDGKVSFGEYFAFVGALGVSSNDAKRCFRDLDTNKNGFLEVEEFCKGCAQYYCDRDPSVNQHFYGRFDDIDACEYGKYPVEPQMEVYMHVEEDSP